MGMYDYLGGEQVKIFYIPIFSKGSVLDKNPSTWHSGGRLRDFNKKDKLPLETLYYKYPKNFIIFDFSYQSEDVWIIKNGKFKEFKNYHEIKAKDLGEAIYTYYGTELNINSIEDFQLIKEEYISSRENAEKQEKEVLSGRNIFDLIKENMKEYEELKSVLDKIREDILDGFDNKWYKEDKYELEKQFGEFLDCYYNFEESKGDEVISDFHNPMQDYLDCKSALKNFIANNKNIIDKYFKWVSLDLKDNEIKVIVKNLMEELDIPLEL